jgi:hypothetical protein
MNLLVPGRTGERGSPERGGEKRTRLLIKGAGMSLIQSTLALMVSCILKVRNSALEQHRIGDTQRMAWSSG